MLLIVGIIFLGIFLWLVNYRFLVLGRDWPLILIFFGILILLRIFKGSKRKSIIRDLEKGRITPSEAEEQLKKL